MDENHKKFLNHLHTSDDTVWFVARWLWEHGQTIYMEPRIEAPSHSVWKNYIDSGDMYIKYNDTWKRIEAKGVSVCFTGINDWPFPDFIVCAKHSFDNANPIPACYIIVSKDKKALAIVNALQHNKWSICKRKDSRYKDVIQEFYLCPLELIKWKKIMSP
jgi:hypothetical protein